MIRPPLLSAAVLAALLAAAPLAASAVDVTVTGKAPPSAAASKPRTGDYKIARRGPHATRARCLEGGNVFVPTRAKASAAERDHDLREACRQIDYTK